MLTRGGIWIRNPRLRFLEDPDPDAGGGDENKGDPAFPANTPVKDMTPEQQAAYNLHQARKHEARVKAFGDWTPEKIEALQNEANTLRTKSQTTEEKAIEDAKEAGRAEIRSVLASERVKNALAKALEGRIPDAGALLDVDRSKFVKGDQADVEAINAWVADNSTETTTTKKTATDLGQGRRGTATPAKGVGAGADLFTGTRKKQPTS